MKTKFLQGCIDEDEASSLFLMLRDDIQWEDGVATKRSGFTRRAKEITPTQYPLLSELVLRCLDALAVEKRYIILGIYLNYYEDGEMHTPNHSHRGTHQLVISLGGARTLNVGKTDHVMRGGDAIIFGSSVHGVKKEPGAEPRISIATFMVPDPSLQQHVFAVADDFQGS